MATEMQDLKKKDRQEIFLDELIILSKWRRLPQTVHHHNHYAKLLSILE